MSPPENTGKAKGTLLRGDTMSPRENTGKAPTLEEIGISKMQASRWRSRVCLTIAERKAGELLKDMEKAKGGRPKTGDTMSPVNNTAKAPTLAKGRRQPFARGLAPQLDTSCTHSV